MNPLEIYQKMMETDAFSRWLGVELVSIGEGHCSIRMTVRPEMVNGFRVAHGGISFSLADSAFAFACNSRGRHTVSIHCTVEHLAPVLSGDVLTASAEEDSAGNTISNYQVRVINQRNELVALFRGVAYRKKTEWVAENSLSLPPK